MEDMTVSAVQLLTSYGAMGICLIYFIVKDFTITKKLEATLQDFTIAMNTFFKVSGGGKND